MGNPKIILTIFFIGFKFILGLNENYDVHLSWFLIHHVQLEV